MSGQKIVECDVTVLGASLAGSAAAIRLSQGSTSIVLVDARQFPRDKCCGEGLSHKGVELLSSLGLESITLPHQPLGGYTIHFAGATAELPVSGERRGALKPGLGIGVNRFVLDSTLLDQAMKRSNVTPLLGARAISCRDLRERCEVELSDGTLIISRYIVVAIGARQNFRLAKRRNDRLNRFGYSFHLENASTSNNAVEIFVEKGYEVFATPVGNGISNIAVVSEKRTFAKLVRKDGQRHVHSMLEQCWKQRLGVVTAPLATGPLGNLRQSSSEGRIFFAGDACEQFDPIGGMGMTHALASGSIAADCLSALLRGDLSLDAAASLYEIERNAAARPLRGFTRLIYLALITMNKTGVSALLAESPLAKVAVETVHHAPARPAAILMSKLVELAGV